MNFVSYFTDDEITAYSTMLTAATAMEGPEDFDEVVADIESTIAGDADKHAVARFIFLGIIMGGYSVQRMHEDANRAKTN